MTDTLTPQAVAEAHHHAADALAQVMIAVLDQQAPEIAKASATLMDRGARLSIQHDMMTGSTVLLLSHEGQTHPLMAIDAEGTARPDGQTLN